MAIYQLTPVRVDAVQFWSHNEAWPVEVKPWSPGAGLTYGSKGYVETPTGCKAVHDGDWILRHPDGTVAVCKSDVFFRTYEPIPDTD